MTWKKRVVSLIACGWIGFVILACTDEDAMVTGDRYSGGGCPTGESCAPPPDSGGGTTVGSPYFLAAQPPRREPAEGELPPVATGATTWVRFVQRYATESRFDDGVYDVVDATLSAEGLPAEPAEYGSRVGLSGMEPGRYVVRVENEEGELYDQVDLRVVDAARVTARPAFGWLGLSVNGVGPDTGWRVWPGAELFYLEEATSSSGEVLVSLEGANDSHYGDVIAPTVGPLEVEVRAGATVSRVSFQLATDVDSFARYLPTECTFGWADSHMCLFGVQDGQPIVGAPIEVRENDDTTYELDEFPCIDRKEESREISFTAAGRTFTTIVPPYGDSCG